MISLQRFLQTASILCITASAIDARAADAPRTVLLDNVILCQPASGCTNRVMLGRTYRALSTTRMIVMISLSNEGRYTRADVSVTNNTALPINLSPEDFRVEVPGPKLKVLQYIAPAELKGLRETPASPQGVPAHLPSLMERVDAQTSDGINRMYEAAAKNRVAVQEAAELEASFKHLPAVAIQPNEVLRGRVYFERVRRAGQVNVVLPIAGTVFKFPYLTRQ